MFGSLSHPLFVEGSFLESIDSKMEKFEAQLMDLGIRLSDLQKRQFERYDFFLEEWNKKINLTSLTSKEQIYTKHFIDSLALAKIIQLKDYKSLVDIGTGAGCPGIPIKIVYPHLQTLLIDSLKKRIVFLQKVIASLKLKGIVAVSGRAEDLARETRYRGQFDLCVSRAVADLCVLSEYCLPYVKVGGLFIAYKSGYAKEEIARAEDAIFLLGGKIRKIACFRLPGTDIGRILVNIEKVKSTGERYPRKAGIPTKRPLGRFDHKTEGKGLPCATSSSLPIKKQSMTFP